jgi:hypothetical protein
MRQRITFSVPYLLNKIYPKKNENEEKNYSLHTDNLPSMLDAIIMFFVVNLTIPLIAVV